MININELEKLAMLRLNDEERASISAELDDIRAYMDILRELDTDGVEAKSHAFDAPCALRDDECKKSLTPDEITANAPDEQDGFFAVPKAFE
ncbi:MAG: Asp-tRNA(Asn)/Glu-tRNA(Gln) amidotransferase subunit GatC [Eubacterium sp.]|nr:Asp-tRNA(Asn)/Glu-tRNA(Gln) amidotransferase subunit GatC [Eubacterium sp.]MBR2278209.1 Asp-tRNA(Asn)/Glu-tRNA(Gln) amidotransferase subunit GatC [Eubacterium sp.]